MDVTGLAASAAIGVGATLLMDVWNLSLKHATKLSSLDYCLLGRWISHFPKGTFRHESIAAAAAMPRECTVGWLSHYTIGIVFALGFMTLTSSDWLEHPTLVPALAYGAATVIFPLFIMQPALGLGIAASRTIDPTRARLKSFVTHLVFGVGLYASALCVSYGVGLVV